VTCAANGISRICDLVTLRMFFNSHTRWLVLNGFGFAAKRL